MAIYRHVQTEFWNDSLVSEVLIPEEKLFFLYLLTNARTTQIGVYQITPKLIAFELGLSIEAVKSLLERFEEKYKVIKYNFETREIAIKNWGKYNLVKGGKPIEDCVKKELKLIHDKYLIEYAHHSITNKKIKEIFTGFLETGKAEHIPSRSQPKKLEKVTVRDYVIVRDGLKCFYTDKELLEVEIEVDHIFPAALGGYGSPSNLVVTSAKLNGIKSMDTIDVFCEAYGLVKEKILKKIAELQAFEQEREENEITLREAVENKIYDTPTLRKYIATIWGQKEKEKKTPRHKFETCDTNGAKYLFEKIKGNNPKQKEPNFDTWSNDFRLMREKDNRELQEIKDVIDWCQADPFWQGNILSPKKLREKFDQLTIQMNSKKGAKNNAESGGSNTNRYSQKGEYDYGF